MNNKPFDPTKPCQYRNGHAARIICVDNVNTTWPIVSATDTGCIRLHKSNGAFDVMETQFDLVNIPEKKTVEFWVNVYGKGDISYHDISYPHPTKHDADLSCGANRIACLHFTREFTEGEGL